LLKLIAVLAGTAMCQFALGDTLVSTQDEYVSAIKNANPGDTIVLADGEWRDFEILFTGTGEEGKPITLTAETRGKVILSGQSNLRLAGRHLVVSGLVFRDGYSPTSAVIQFRRTQGDYAYHSRVTEVVIDHFNNPERYESDSWVLMFGKHNRFDHNHLVGKNNRGVTMAVRLNSEESQQNHHRIDHNYFGPRPVLGSNGGETLRIGTSHYSLTDSFTVVENNYFDRCDGEVEIISSKSGSNVIRGNLFFESRGTLTLRHGNGTLVENNVFLGNRVDHTGGIRVINKRQTVRNNYMYGLTGHRFGGGFVIMNGVPNSPINRYHQVEDSVVENNSIINSDHIELAAGADDERSAPPKTTAFRNNLIYNEEDPNVFAVHDDISGIAFDGNVLGGAVTAPAEQGFTSADVNLEKAANGLFYPAGDMEGVGASRDLVVLDKEATGVSWYPKPAAGNRFGTGKEIPVAVGDDTVSKAFAKAGAGDVLVLEPGVHIVQRTLVLNRPVTVRSSDEDNPAEVQFERQALFEIRDGGSLRLEGITISGKSSPDRNGNSAIRTGRYSMLKNYVLEIDNVDVRDLDMNHSFDFFSVASHTFADRIEISNSSFTNITGHILFLNKEIEDIGIYNGEYISITDSSFENVEKTIADIYRGGTDESTFGPHFLLANSTIKNVGTGSRNKAEASVRLHGVQATNIHNNVLEDSQPLRIRHTVGEPVTTLSDNDFINTPATELIEFSRSN
jgi:poly(beta-D-mannuronate) lyase